MGADAGAGGDENGTGSGLRRERYESWEERWIEAVLVVAGDC